MTEIEMRNYLEGHFYASKKIKALEAERRQLRLNAQGCSVGYEGSYASTKQNGTERNLISLADEEKNIDEQIVKLRAEQKKVRQLIGELHDNDLEAVLIFRYILHHSIEESAEQLNYHPNTVKEKIKRAVEKLCTKMY
ncbi:MAG: sigma-70 family RNA polymerase sigma factor [Ruminococcus sp.]|nr:sigma-70 family RNA polymerase sigma factor [Ruminococcus sp.]